MKKDKTESEIRKELEKEFSRWNALACGECSDPGWEDGVNMNLVRNHIIFYYRSLEDMGCILKNLFGEILEERPIPPEVPNNYMVKDGKFPERYIYKSGRKFTWGRSGEYHA